MAYETPLKIIDVIQDISKNNYVLPSIQREYVWGAEQIETLFDSILRDYPIGAFLFWGVNNERIADFDYYEFLKDYHERDNYQNQKINLVGSNNITAVLDGQQRLTSIYIGLKGSYAEKLPYQRKNNDNAFPQKKLYLNLISLSSDERFKYDFKFIPISNIENSDTEHWFEVGKIISMKDIGDVMEYITDNISYSENFTYNKEQTNLSMRILTKLYNVIHKEQTISYYIERTDDLEKVLNIFIRVNSGGTILSYSDLLLSIASAQWEDFDAREEITDFVREINIVGNGFNINKDFVLKSALVLSDFNNIAFKVDNFNKENMRIIEGKWKIIKKAIINAVKLVASFGYSRETLRSNNALIPLAYYLMTIQLPDNFVESSKYNEDKLIIKKWLMRSLLKKSFSGQPDNVLRPIRKIIKENDSIQFPYDKIVDYFKGTNKSLIFTIDDIDEYLLELKYGSRDSLSLLMMLYPSLDYNNKFHVDHIYPKSKFNRRYLKELNIPTERIDAYLSKVNNISNLQLLPAIPNIEKQDENFGVWFNNNFKTETDKEQYKATHYIPSLNDYSLNSFNDFYEKRRTLLREKLIELLLD